MTETDGNLSWFTMKPWPYLTSPPTENEEFAPWLARNLEVRGAKAELARRLQCLPMSVAMWASGQCAPRPDTEIAIRALPGGGEAPQSGKGLAPLRLEGDFDAGEARAQLVGWLRQSGAGAYLAREVGVNAARVSLWKSTHARPTPEQAQAVERVTGIPWRWWCDSGRWTKDVNWTRQIVRFADRLSCWAKLWNTYVPPAKAHHRCRIPEDRFAALCAGAEPTTEEWRSIDAVW